MLLKFDTQHDTYIFYPLIWICEQLLRTTIWLIGIGDKCVQIDYTIYWFDPRERFVGLVLFGFKSARLIILYTVFGLNALSNCHQYENNEQST